MFIDNLYVILFVWLLCEYASCEVILFCSTQPKERTLRMVNAKEWIIKQIVGVIVIYTVGKIVYFVIIWQLSGLSLWESLRNAG